MLSKFVEDGQTATGVPGVSVGIIQDGKVVFAGGFGVRELAKPAKVDADTRYMIASNTKGLLGYEIVDLKHATTTFALLAASHNGGGNQFGKANGHKRFLFLTEDGTLI